jgi:1-acyl-sn-glycerol-3-phosphate acyltransferase
MKYSLGRGIGGFFLRAGGQVALQRDSGHQALRVCLELLRRGRAVGIFPEGSRGDGRMRQIKAGVAWLAISSGAPVVPFACLGTRHDGEAATRFPPPRRKVYVSFGAPVELVLDKSASRREQIGAAMEQIRLALAAHVAKALEESPVGLPDDTGRVNS